MCENYWTRKYSLCQIFSDKIPSLFLSFRLFFICLKISYRFRTVKFEWLFSQTISRERSRLFREATTFLARVFYLPICIRNAVDRWPRAPNLKSRTKFLIDEQDALETSRCPIYFQFVSVMLLRVLRDLSLARISRLWWHKIG